MIAGQMLDSARSGAGAININSRIITVGERDEEICRAASSFVEDEELNHQHIIVAHTYTLHAGADLPICLLAPQ